MKLRFLVETIRGIWMLYNPESYIPMVKDFFTNGKIDSAEKAEVPPITYIPLDSAPGSPLRNQKIAVVQLHGTMTKYETCFTYGAVDIAQQLVDCANDPDIVGIVLDIDSPGGSISAISPLLEAIAAVKTTGKPILAHCDSCYSAAYYVASQCDAIFADNQYSGIGSIGVYSELVDDREDKSTGYRIVQVYAKESPDKNRPQREALDGNIEPLQDKLSFVARSFQDAVKKGRSNLKADAKGVLTGDTFYAEEAISVGLIDGIATLGQVIDNTMARSLV